MLRRIGIIALSFLILLAGIILVLALVTPRAADYPFFDQAGPLVIAHQGGEQLRPSNTMPAFENAVALGVDVLEMDTHSTQDGVLVVMHDDTVDRTTDGNGRIQDLTLAQIKQLDAGYYWTDDEGQTYPYRGQGITVPTLEEVFAAFPDMPMNIEIKQSDPSIVQTFCDLLDQYDMQDQVLIPSFHPDTMVEFREKCPGVASSMTEPEIRRFFVLNTLHLGRLFGPPGEAFQVPEYSGSLHVVTDRFVTGAHERNIDVHVWTVNDPADMQRLIDLGVDGIITDRPDLLLEVLGRR
ncbi:MAG: glycerophosphodiester phosphodiesterase [Anaerolineales bacterium]|nr:glycerophosphodiester phosphodiesterase [Anaerolineales bacterium]